MPECSCHQETDAEAGEAVFFDADLAVCGSGRGLDPPATASDALRVMEHYGIGRALVYDRSVMEAGLFGDWHAILGFCQESAGRLLPTVPVAPPSCGEMPPAQELVREAVANGVVGMRVWPEYHAFDLNPRQWRPLLDPMQSHRMPLIVHMDEQHAWQYRRRWNEVAGLAEAFPRLPIIVLWAGMRDARRFLPLLDSCPNVLMDVTPATFQMIEFITAEWGAGRLLFASHYPLHDPGIYAAPILYADIAPSDRISIARGNLGRIVEAVK